MSLTADQKKKIKELLRTKIKGKLANYARETTSMPFLAKIIQDEEKVAAYSFIHSLATTLGTSIYENVAKIIAEPSSQEVGTKVKVDGTLSSAQKSVIDRIKNDLRNGVRKANKAKETQEVLKASSTGGKPQKDGNEVDFYMKRNGVEYYFEIKTSKPNIDVFTKSKEKLLEWIARKKKPVKTLVVFPYNPYHPKPYNRFTEQGVLEKGEEFLVGDEFWDFLGGKNTYNDLIQVFDEVGKELRKDIDAKIKEVARTKMKV
ncbi:MAG: TdeIII family type II restriction endonuclease [Candidatus Aenigmarchaeota archaeon]|nr:TdeIII family type II restriction endonuclease [Candidatus Aenigmarchaeota archaeon]